ncbi:MAG: DUF2783 domain-containing protein [Proteobacteria bacterium]|nr:DUF2783 domain-containing protein [Pseudomonadota bacterium]MDA1308809.1 DUF2783 domain-containing protein [Pseudomonadota bacterium]
MNTPSSLSFEDLERVYALLAETIDGLGPEREALFLSKLTLVLAQALGDFETVTRAMDTARRDLD